MKNIILFDMDGTLTEARQQIEPQMINQILEILEHGHEVGIVTGSPEEYVNQQIGDLIDLVIEVGHGSNFHILPCNGTEYIFYDDNGERNEVVPDNMETNLGTENFTELMAALCHLQTEIAGAFWRDKLPLTGNFIQYRGSMINWCPIGRNASNEQRAQFVAFDEASGFRKEYIRIINQWIDWRELELTVALGGSTSFDIYPTGWDKTYCLTWFGDRICWFVGDKCKEGGNDKQLYDTLVKSGRAFETASPEDTEAIIKGILKTLSPDSSAG
tara:strand:- start:55954 stop:56769 length:816 start_codon:yes stop_codon:yes gene_type:complete